MIKGMTGFGHSSFSAGKTKGVIEIKTVNHRYLDLNFYLPSGFGAVENKIRQILQKSLHRGRVTISLKITQKPSQMFSFNKEAVRQYLKYSQSLKAEFHLTGELSISELIQLPGVVDVGESAIDPEDLSSAIEKSMKKALQGLDHMRQREGKALSADINDKLKRMIRRAKSIESRAKVILAEQKRILSNEEFSSFQKSNDVNEEISRLIHYVEEFRMLLKSNESVGKKLDFVAQEMQRETNTIGSKIQDKLVANEVIALKSKIEKIREQSQNIE